jgi:hypothetical protein
MMNSFQHGENDTVELEKNESSEQLYGDLLYSATYHTNSIIDIFMN